MSVVKHPGGYRMRIGNRRAMLYTPDPIEMPTIKPQGPVQVVGNEYRQVFDIPDAPAGGWAYIVGLYRGETKQFVSAGIGVEVSLGTVDQTPASAEFFLRKPGKLSAAQYVPLAFPTDGNGERPRVVAGIADVNRAVGDPGATLVVETAAAFSADAETYNLTLSDGSTIPTIVSFDAETGTVIIPGDVAGEYALRASATNEFGTSETILFRMDVFDNNLRLVDPYVMSGPTPAVGVQWSITEVGSFSGDGGGPYTIDIRPVRDGVPFGTFSPAAGYTYTFTADDFGHAITWRVRPAGLTQREVFDVEGIALVEDTGNIGKPTVVGVIPPVKVSPGATAARTAAGVFQSSLPIQYSMYRQGAISGSGQVLWQPDQAYWNALAVDPSFLKSEENPLGVVHTGTATAIPGGLRVGFPAGGVGAGVQKSLNLPNRTQECYLEFDVFFPEDFPWTEGGKMIGMGGGDPQQAGQGAGSIGSFSLTPTWRELVINDPRFRDYYYWPQQPFAAGGYPDNVWNAPLLRGVKHRVGIYYKMNTIKNGVPQNDGITRSYLDGFLAKEKTDLLLIDDPLTQGVEYLRFRMFFGGQEMRHAPPFDTFIEITNVKVYASMPTNNLPAGYGVNVTTGEIQLPLPSATVIPEELLTVRATDTNGDFAEASFTFEVAKAFGFKTIPTFAPQVPPGTAVDSIWSVSGWQFENFTPPVTVRVRNLRNSAAINNYNTDVTYRIAQTDLGATIQAEVEAVDSSTPPQRKTVIANGSAVIPNDVPTVVVNTMALLKSTVQAEMKKPGQRKIALLPGDYIGGWGTGDNAITGIVKVGADGNGVNDNNRLIITSADPNNPARIKDTGFYFRGMDGLTFDGLLLEGTQRVAASQPGDPNTYPKGGVNAFKFTDCKNYTVRNCTLKGWRDAANNFRGTNVRWEYNAFIKIGKDFLRHFDRNTKVRIHANFFGDPDIDIAVAQLGPNHPDFNSMQVDTVGDQKGNVDVEITENDFRSHPHYLQGIFMPNANVKANPAKWATHRHENIRIRRNRLRTCHTNTLLVAGAKDVWIEDNWLVPTHPTFGEPGVWVDDARAKPLITLRDRIENLNVSRNVTFWPINTSQLNNASTGINIDNTNKVDKTELAAPAVFPRKNGVAVAFPSGPYAYLQAA